MQKVSVTKEKKGSPVWLAELKERQRGKQEKCLFCYRQELQITFLLFLLPRRTSPKNVRSWGGVENKLISASAVGEP
jgi:hypothetical protein